MIRHEICGMVNWSCEVKITAYTHIYRESSVCMLPIFMTILSESVREWSLSICYPVHTQTAKHVECCLCFPVIHPCDCIIKIENWPIKKNKKMRMLKVKFKSDVRGVREETADRDVAAVTTQERFEGLYAATKFFLKFRFGFSLISEHSHPYPFACCFSWFSSRQWAHDPTISWHISTCL